jgi:glycosyltransferase involved in cell wall biosynthesis
MIKEYGVKEHVIFFGPVSEAKKYNLMSRAHLLLHASVKEGWGLVVLEAAYMGTPSVVYNVPGLRDVVKHQKTGIVVANNSPHEMAREAVLLYKDKKRYTEFEKNGRVWAQSLSWKKVVFQSLQLLHSAIQRSSK